MGSRLSSGILAAALGVALADKPPVAPEA